MLQYIFCALQWLLRCQSKFRLHLSPTLIHFNKFVSLNSIQNKVHKLTFWSSIQYFFIPASNITTRLLLFCWDSALECDFLTIYFFPRCISHYCVVIIHRHVENEPMFELPAAHYYLSDKVGADHWAAHYVI